jgi:predicted HD superfamily hydrolase involved in NAD metabolism
MDCAELSRVLEASLGQTLSPERAGHSRRVAELAASLCEREGMDPARGRAAGLAHDLCKEMPKGEQRKLAELYAHAMPAAAESSALMADKVMHGPAAAALLARDYGVKDSGLLEAIALHTVGRPGMDSFSIILYCSDKLEPGRERIGAEYRARCLAMPLNDMLFSVVGGVVGWMRGQGKPVAPETLILYSTLGREASVK